MNISVIIPSYKPMEYIYTCLDSLKNQTLSVDEYEVIVILNGCKEPYYTQLEKYFNREYKEVNLNFIQIDQGGVSNARNIGLNVAKGKYITFVDDDDYISASYLDEMYRIAITGSMPITNIIAFTEGINTSQPYYITDLFNTNLNSGVRQIMQVRSYFSIPYCKLIDRDIITNRRFNTKFKNGEDGLFIFSISDRVKNIELTSKKAIYYRRYRDGSAVYSQSKKVLVATNINLIKEYTSLYLKHIFKYDFLFYITRILASIQNIINGLRGIQNKIK